MTEPAIALATTSASPTGRQLWTSSRHLLLALAVLVVAGLALAAVRSGERHGVLDPHSADRYGSRAVAELLADRGVTTDVVTTTAEAVSALGPHSTLLVTNPDLLASRQQASLREAAAESGGRMVLLAPGPASVSGLAPGVRAASPTDVAVRSPNCPLAAARRAGAAELGGFRYTASTTDSSACYPSKGLATLLHLPHPGGSDTVILGTTDILGNDRLDEQGNASLALQLLGSHPHLAWYLPSLSDSAAADGGNRSFFDLIPDGWRWGLLQLAIATVLAALWRARRFGPLITERLPVAVRASEATEGRARLYQQANARDRAAEALRSATRARLAPLLGVPALHAHRPEALSPAVSAHVTSPAVDVSSLLFGLAPPHDADLVRLADELDDLERRVISAAVTRPDARGSTTQHFSTGPHPTKRIPPRECPDSES